MLPWGLTEEELKQDEGDCGDPPVFRIMNSVTDGLVCASSENGTTQDGTTLPPQQQSSSSSSSSDKILSPEEAFVAKCRILVCLASPGLLVQLPLFSKYATYACVLGPYVQNLGLELEVGLGQESGQGLGQGVSDEAKGPTDGKEEAVGAMDVRDNTQSSSSSSSASSSSSSPSSSSPSSSTTAQRIVVFDGERNRIVLASQCSSIISDDAFLGDPLVSTTHIYPLASTTNI